MENTSHSQNTISYSFLYISAALHRHLLALLIYINFPMNYELSTWTTLFAFAFKDSDRFYKDNTDNT